MITKIRSDWSCQIANPYKLCTYRGGIEVRCSSGTLMSLLIWLRRTMQQWLTVLFSGPDNPQPAGGSRPPCNKWFLWLTRVSLSHRISIGSAVLLGSRTWPTHTHTHRQTYRQTTLLRLRRYSFCSNRPHPAIAAMWPNNYGRRWLYYFRKFVICVQP